jgi:hypothetical protein
MHSSVVFGFRLPREWREPTKKAPARDTRRTLLPVRYLAISRLTSLAAMDTLGAALRAVVSHSCGFCAASSRPPKPKARPAATRSSLCNAILRELSETPSGSVAQKMQTIIYRMGEVPDQPLIIDEADFIIRRGRMVMVTYLWDKTHRDYQHSNDGRGDAMKRGPRPGARPLRRLSRPAKLTSVVSWTATMRRRRAVLAVRSTSGARMSP